MIACLALLLFTNMEVSKSRLESTVRQLSSFSTRNTLSPTCAEAAEWLAGEFRKIPEVQVEKMVHRLPKGSRVPEEMDAVQVVATSLGETKDCIIVGGHLDSLVLGVDPKTGRAPGANDDATGVAIALEMARILAGKKLRNTVKFVAFTGEEQGLLGSKALAKRAKDEKWPIIAVLNNDTVGSTVGHPNKEDRQCIRVFSEEYQGLAGESHQSRELARFIEYCARPIRGSRVKLVYRKDRFGRGGDHSPFVAEGFTAVRFTETYEDFSRQHTGDDLPEKVDWTYVRNVAKVNLAVLLKLVQAGPPPTEVRVDPKQSYDTILRWKGTGVFRVYWRDSASATWQGSMLVDSANEVTVKGINKDHSFFAVGAEGGIPVIAQ